MHTETLTDIPYRPDTAGLLKKLHIKEGSRNEGAFWAMLEEALGAARPKALYRMAFIDQKLDQGVMIDGITFNSRVLRVNLESAQRVFAYVATCGIELAGWAATRSDMLEKFWADAVMHDALRCARAALAEYLNRRYQLPSTSTMNPGSLEDWPIEQQAPLFTLLGDTEAAVGVRLTESFLMLPVKSVSGLRFPTAESFESCQLCPRPDCPGRRAPYDSGLYERKYQAA